MPRTFAAALPLLVALTLLAPGKVVAGPPEEASGRMVLDEVADGLRKYKKEPKSARRIDRLRELASTHDPRVAVALWEVYSTARTEEEKTAAEIFLVWFYRAFDRPDLPQWWDRYGPDLRRRAAQLPR